MLSAPWGSFSVTYREKETPCQAQGSYLCPFRSLSEAGKVWMIPGHPFVGTVMRDITVLLLCTLGC